MKKIIMSVMLVFPMVLLSSAKLNDRKPIPPSVISLVKRSDEEQLRYFRSRTDKQHEWLLRTLKDGLDTFQKELLWQRSRLASIDPEVEELHSLERKMSELKEPLTSRELFLLYRFRVENTDIPTDSEVEEIYSIERKMSELKEPLTSREIFLLHRLRVENANIPTEVRDLLSAKASLPAEIQDKSNLCARALKLERNLRKYLANRENAQRAERFRGELQTIDMDLNIYKHELSARKNMLAEIAQYLEDPSLPDTQKAEYTRARSEIAEEVQFVMDQITKLVLDKGALNERLRALGDRGVDSAAA